MAAFEYMKRGAQVRLEWHQVDVMAHRPHRLPHAVMEKSRRRQSHNLDIWHAPYTFYVRVRSRKLVAPLTLAVARPKSATAG